MLWLTTIFVNKCGVCGIRFVLHVQSLIEKNTPPPPLTCEIEFIKIVPMFVWSIRMRIQSRN